MDYATYLLSTLFLLFAVLLQVLRRKSSLPAPPGPDGLPVVGNLFQVPSSLTWVKLVEWSKEYGSMYRYKLLNQPIIVLSGIREAADLLDRLSARTSERPKLIKVNEYLCRHMEFGFEPKSDFWRIQRRASHENFNVRAAKQFQPMQEEESRLLITGLLEHPEVDIVKHIHRHSASIGWRSIYGHKPIPLIGHDPSAPMDDFFKEVFLAAVPGGSIVDIFPFLEPLISRFGFLRRQSDKFYEQATDFFVKAHREPQVDGNPSFSGKLKESGERIGMSSDKDCGWAGGTLFIAAQDTTATALRWFWVAMLCYPEAATAARKELDAVVSSRPPTFDDYDSLPQIEAMVKELLRWRPPTPSGLPHMAAEDIVYDGYLIPKGAILTANLWSLCRDPILYPNGDVFDPSRILDSQGRVRRPPPDSHDDLLTFGYGRRVCVGKSLALNTLWISIAQLLWAFDFQRVKDEDGKEKVPDEMAFWDNGLTVWPSPFEFKLVPRFADLKEKIRLSTSE